ncbi:ACT domain-containing protein [Corynebacterium uterequi]|uniref:ACT domain-containing protein n=1 Tax=Corynebacterium uterequi TaxID=1072256 RepID=A0A0G3HDX3_9CORY|nr:amino acid-binding ACT domain protein [Corynebacterium uterequi]AKK10925.1 ACT domain-containing protein [Corynebacterium uterequi]
MSYLLRVQLPDEPGNLGALAEALGMVGANIQSVDIVETSPHGTVTDDIVVDLPKPAMADTLITAVDSVPGAEVDSIRPFSGRVDRRGQIEMLAGIATSRVLDDAVAAFPHTVTASWAIILDTRGPVSRVAASAAAPEEDGTVPEDIAVSTARILHPETEAWIPESWAVLDTALAACPLADTDYVLVIGRVGGPDFLSSEVTHLGNLALITGRLLRR